MGNLAGELEHARLRDRLQKENLKLVTFGMREYHLSRPGAAFIANAEIVANFDSDRYKWGTEGPLGVQTLPPERIVDFISKVDAVVVMSFLIAEIGEQLDQLGVGEYFWLERMSEEISDEERALAEKDAAAFRANAKCIDEVRGLLADERSVAIFDALLASRQSLKKQERIQLVAPNFSWPIRL